MWLLIHTISKVEYIDCQRIGHVDLTAINTLRSRQHGRHFTDDTFKRIFLNGMTSRWAQWRLKSPASRLFTQLFIHKSKKTSKLRVTGICEGNSPVTGEFHAQRSSNFIWRRHHEISIKFSLKFDRQGPSNNIPVLVQIMAWRRPGDKPLSEPMLVSLLTHTCVTRPQWVKLEFLMWYPVI